MPCIVPITAPPLEAVQAAQEASLHHRREFGVPITDPIRPGINSIAAKDPALQRPVPQTDSAKFGLDSSSGLLFRDNNSASPFFTSDSHESPTLFTNPNLVSNSSVTPSPLLGTTTHTNSPAMDLFPGSASLNLSTGSFLPTPRPNQSDSDLAIKKLFEDCLVDGYAEDNPFLFTPYTTETSSFTNSTLSSGLDTPSIDLAQLDSYLNATSFGTHDFNLFGDTNGLNSEEWNQNPLFNPGMLAEDPIAPYALFKHTATVSSASPQQFSFSSVGDNQSLKTETLPSPELTPSISRKPATRRPTIGKPAPRRTSTAATPFTPITPAPTIPSTPQPVISRATKRRIPVVDEDPNIVEKRRRNTVAAQRSRARKAEEKAEDKARIEELEQERDNLRVLLSFWKDRACELGASPLEDGET
jgi:hypothetical protein